MTFYPCKAARARGEVDGNLSCIHTGLRRGRGGGHGKTQDRQQEVLLNSLALPVLIFASIRYDERAVLSIIQLIAQREAECTFAPPVETP